jgi:hypothetical protein
MERVIESKGPGKSSPPKPGFKQELKTVPPPKEHIEMSILHNSVYYFLEHVFILCQGDSYRLMVLHHNRLLLDRNYRSLRGARIAFQKLFRHKAWKEDVKSIWSHCYPPDDDWLEEKNTASGLATPTDCGTLCHPAAH